VCGTPYTVDKGTGHGEVVQDCKYEVYAEWCSYTAQEWRPVAPLTLSGNDLNPRWPDTPLAANQRAGEREERYEVVFETEDKRYTYSTSDVNTFQRCQIGSRWVLQTNALGGVRSIEPAP
jgi:hypothetical protein